MSDIHKNMLFNSFINYPYVLPIVAIIINIFVLQITMNRVKHNGTCDKDPLFDLIHHYVPNLNNYNNYLNIVLLVFIVPFMFQKNRHNLYCFINLFSFVVILRSVAVLLTDLPSSDNDCDISDQSLSSYVFGHCHDKIFSGHIAFTLLATLIIIDNNMVGKYRNLYIILQILYSLFIVISRNHYSIDVLLSYYIVMPLYYCISNYQS